MEEEHGSNLIRDSPSSKPTYGYLYSRRFFICLSVLSLLFFFCWVGEGAVIIVVALSYYRIFIPSRWWW